MRSNGPAVDDLRGALTDLAEEGLRAPGCPDPVEFWDAQRGELSASATRDLVEHTTRCPRCAEAWRVAHDMGAMREEAPGHRSSMTWKVTLAAAAVIVLAVGLISVFPPGERVGEPVFRSGQGVVIEALTDETVPLPRKDFRLRWSQGPDGTVYSVRVTTESFAAVAMVDGLDLPEWQVPEEALEGIAGGTRLLWRVEAFLPDGRKVQSETYFVELE
jgi:hypothetical protein